jgi:hypothetical protein
MSASAYAVASKSIIAKSFDSELTLINLETGQYFAAGGSAVDFWEIAARGATAGRIEQALLARYLASEAAVKTEVEKLLRLFLEHGLLAESADSADEIPPPGGPQKPWEPGWLEVYGDMKELLLLDPIHDVETEWPVAKKA